MSDERELLFMVLDKGIEEKLAKKMVRLLTRETIEKIFSASLTECKDSFISNRQQVDKLKADRDSNPDYKTACDDKKLFDSSFRKTAQYYLVMNEALLEIMEDVAT